MDFTSIIDIAKDCRSKEEQLNNRLVILKKEVEKELTPLIGKVVKVTYYTTEAYAIKHGHSIQEYIGTFKGFSRNGFLHITNNGLYQNIRPMRIIDIQLY